MFHDAKLNISRQHTVWLCGRMMGVLQEIDTDFGPSQGVVGLTLNPVLHTDLSSGRWINDGLFEHRPNDSGIGMHLMVSFWAYGDDNDQVFSNLDRLFSNVRRACESVSQEIRQATAPARLLLLAFRLPFLFRRRPGEALYRAGRARPNGRVRAPGLHRTMP